MILCELPMFFFIHTLETTEKEAKETWKRNVDFSFKSLIKLTARRPLKPGYQLAWLRWRSKTTALSPSKEEKWLAHHFLRRPYVGDSLHFTSLGGTSQQFGMLHVFNGLNNIVFFFGKLKFQAQERSDIGSNLMMNWKRWSLWRLELIVKMMLTSRIMMI